MQSATLTRRQELRAIPVQIQANTILSMSLLELQQFVDAEIQENPALNIEDAHRCPVCGIPTTESVCPVCGAQARKTESSDDASTERDYLERAFAAAEEKAGLDPFLSVAAEQDLLSYLKQQARMCLGGRQLRIAEYLIELLDDDGYFRESLFDAAEPFAAAVPEMESVLRIIQSFDPPGIAARDLRECLLIQLRALEEPPPSAADAERILVEFWDEFSKMKLSRIATAMEVDEDTIREACELIRDRLTPHPVSLYHTPFNDLCPRFAASVAPDVIVHERGDVLAAEVVDYHGSILGVDETYQEVYKSIKRGGAYLTEEDRQHIKQSVERANGILEAIGLRKKTLGLVAMHIVEHQQGFIRGGAADLKPLKQKDVAKALQVHESTVCRALSSKYCRLPSGEVVSFDVFFDSALPVRSMIKELISGSAEPLSDGEIARRLSQRGVNIARRTVAKYRNQLKLLPCQLRAA